MKRGRGVGVPRNLWYNFKGFDKYYYHKHRFVEKFVNKKEFFDYEYL